MFVRWNDTLKFYEYDTSAGQTGAGPWLQLPNVVYEDQNNVFTAPIQTIESNHPMILFKQTAIPPGNRATRIEGFSDLYFSHVNDANDAYVTRMSFARSGDLHILNGRVFERGRGTPIGDWTNYTPVLTNEIPSVSLSGGTFKGAFMLLGRTMFINYQISAVTVTGTGEGYIRISLPAQVGGTGLTMNIHGQPVGVYLAGWKTAMSEAAAGDFSFTIYMYFTGGTVFYTYGQLTIPAYI